LWVRFFIRPDFFLTDIFSGESHAMISRYLSIARSYLKRLGIKIAEDNIFFLASGIAFDILLCAIPTLLLIASAAGALFRSSEDAVALVSDYISQFLPNGREAVLSLILPLIESQTSLSIVGIVGLLWTSMSLSGSLRIILSMIFDETTPRPFLRGKLVDLLMVLVLSVFFLATVSVTGLVGIAENLGIEQLGLNRERVGFLFKFASLLVSLLLDVAMFFCAYKFLPASEISWRVAAVGAISAALLWEAAKQGFSYYITNLTGTERLYGAYSALVALALWIYYSGLIFILAGEIAQTFALRQEVVRSEEESTGARSENCVSAPLNNQEARRERRKC
jgi:membrane protein